MCDKFSSSTSLRCNRTFASTNSGDCRRLPVAAVASFFAAVTALAVAGQAISWACQSRPFAAVREQKGMLLLDPSRARGLLPLEYQLRELPAHSVRAAHCARQVALVDGLADQLLLLRNKRSQRFAQQCSRIALAQATP